MTESGQVHELEKLLARYNRAFYDRDLAALRALYLPDVEVPYFDNHADGDSTELKTHLEKVATFFETGDIVSLLSRTFGLRPWRCRVRGRHGPLLCGTGILEFGHRSSWSVMCGHGGFAMSLLAGTK